MVDFLKILVQDRGLIDGFHANPLLVWHDRREKLSHFDFEVIQSRETKTYNGILFCFYDHKLEILFRPHYYFNQDLHNANDFTAGDCMAVVSEFTKTFGIKDLHQFKIINLEFGLNIKSPMDVKDLVSFIHLHQRNEFKTDIGLAYSKKAYRPTKWGKVSPYKIIKAYAKGLQFPGIADRNLFRFEVKSKKSRYINSLGITDISDLLNPGTYNTLANQLEGEFAKVLILDGNTTFDNLTGKEKKSLEKYLNTHTWYRILQDKNRNKFNYHKKKYISLLDKTKNNIHDRLENLVQVKLKKLKNGAISQPLSQRKVSAISPINIMGNCTKNDIPSPRICPVTKMDISMQKKGSFLLSNTGLKNLEKTNPSYFAYLKQNLLTGNYNRFERNVYAKLSKQIRNRYFNNVSKYITNQPELF